MEMFRAITFALLLTTVNSHAVVINPTKPPLEAEITEARTLVERMRTSERGPYSRIRWFCNDGSVQPPQAGACSNRGGGRQHAEYSIDRSRLAVLGWHVGTVFANLPWEEFWGTHPRRLRLRELPLERFMVETDDGWVLNKAQHYRGRVQIEDEEAAGRALLLRLMAQRDWIAENFLLVRHVAQTVPQGGARDRTQQVRHLAQVIADKDTRFTRLRIEVHSTPSPHTAARIRAWIKSHPDLPAGLRDDGEKLAAGLDELYGEAARRARLAKAEQSLSQTIPVVAARLGKARQAQGVNRIELLSEAMSLLRRHIPVTDASASLYRLNLLLALETELRVAASEELSKQTLSRRELLVLANLLLQAAHAGAWLSDTEFEALGTPIQELLHDASVDGNRYARTVRRLSLAAGWAAMSVRYHFNEALNRYIALAPQAERFVDEALRASILLPLGEIAHRLALDAADQSGLAHHFLGVPGADPLGINPGVARARLRVLGSAELAAGVQPRVDEIVVLPETVAELSPVAGILTMGEGNPLSHVQMLARNLGIPNAVISPRLLQRLQSINGAEVLLAVAADGRVYLETQDRLPSSLRRAEPKTRAQSEELLTPPPPDLNRKHLLPLAELHSGLSGRVVGPKAANVGELARRFPGRIAPALAIPFGIFADHTPVQRQAVADAYLQFRNGEIDQDQLDRVLDHVRGEVADVTLDPGLLRQLREAMRKEFGPEDSYGLFVRSDTNVEDLPEFTGAGLNETLPNVVGMQAQLQGIKRVWSSVYTRRAMAWRGRILAHPDQVYASILLMKSIPSEKSGVLVTTDLHSGGEGLTVSTAWGVGGAVDNESAASRVLYADGGSLLLAEAKAAYQRRLGEGGGIQWLPAAAGTVLTSAEQAELRALAAEVVAQYPPSKDASGRALPWDIEFAFAGGHLWLLQIRPLIQRGQVEAARLIDTVLPAATPVAQVPLEQAPAHSAETTP